MTSAGEFAPGRGELHRCHWRRAGREFAKLPRALANSTNRPCSRRSSAGKVAGHVAGNFFSKSLCRHWFCDAGFQLTATPHSHSDFAVRKDAGKRSLDARANTIVCYGHRLGGQLFKAAHRTTWGSAGSFCYPKTGRFEPCPFFHSSFLILHSNPGHTNEE